MINVYVVSQIGPAAVYGIGSYIRELVQSLKGEKSICITILHLFSNKDSLLIEKEDDVIHWHIPQNIIRRSPLATNERYLKNVIYLLRLHLPQNENMIFHLNYNGWHPLIEGLRSSYDCRIISVVHYLQWQLSLLNNKTRFKALLRKDDEQKTLQEQKICSSFEEEQISFQSVDHIISLSQHTSNTLSKEYGIDRTKISIIPNGLKDYKPEQREKDLLRKKWRLSSAEPIVLFVGRLNPEKGLEFLIRAFRKVLDVLPECRLIIAGEGHFSPYLEEAQTVCTRVTFTGLLKKAEVYELYRMADVGVMTSFHEQCSYVAMEMMMHGVPLIASTTPSLYEMIENDISGLHIPVMEHSDTVEIDPEVLAQKILYILQNQEVASRLGQNGRKRYETIYSAANMSQNMKELYSKLASS
jgi:glycosyltransferase